MEYKPHQGLRRIPPPLLKAHFLTCREGTDEGSIEGCGRDIGNSMDRLGGGARLEASGGLEGKYLGEIWKGQQMTRVKQVRQKHTPHYSIHP